MKWHRMLSAGATILSLAAVDVSAADKAAQQAEVLPVARATLQDLYKSQPDLKAQVQKAPGYAVFTTYGLSFIIGGGGAGQNVIANANYYTLTRNGVQAGGALAGTKVWKDPDLD